MAEIIKKGHPDYGRLWNEQNQRKAGRCHKYQSMTDHPNPTYAPHYQEVASPADIGHLKKIFQKIELHQLSF